MDTYAYHYYSSRCVSFTFSTYSFIFFHNLSYLLAAKLHSAFLRLAVIYACDFTAAKKKSRNVAKLLRINSF